MDSSETTISQWKLETVTSWTRKSLVGFRPRVLNPGPSSNVPAWVSPANTSFIIGFTPGSCIVYRPDDPLSNGKIPSDHDACSWYTLKSSLTRSALHECHRRHWRHFAA